LIYQGLRIWIFFMYLGGVGMGRNLRGLDD
jgi:hypothetical protein